jgi:hypothetical protein
MDVLEKFLYSIAYKFPKGYPDMKNEQDILILENEIKKLGIEELDRGGSFTVTDKKDVLAQLQGKIKIDKAITLGVDEDGKTITTSDLKKTADFGGGGGMRGGSELTAQAESAQCIANAIRYNSSEDITEESITDEAIQASKSKIAVTDFESAANLLKTNRGWLISSVGIANALAKQYSGPFIHNRGSNWVKNLENKVKPLLKEAGIKDINKWNPADIWMVAPEELEIIWPNTLGEINALLLEKYNNGTIVGVSLKKADKNVTLKVYNAGSSEDNKYEITGIEVNPSHAKAYVLLSDGSKIEFRNFNALTGFMGELALKKAAGGKVGYSIIKKVFADNGFDLSSPTEIKDEVVNDDPDFKNKFKTLWGNIPQLSDLIFINMNKTRLRNLIKEVYHHVTEEKCSCGCNTCENVGNAGVLLNESVAPKEILSENLRYHVVNQLPLTENTFRYGSESFLIYGQKLVHYIYVKLFM